MTRARLIRRLLPAAAVLLLTGLDLSGDARGQSPRRGQNAVGTEVLRWLLHEQGFKPVSKPEKMGVNPARNVLIVLGDVSWLEHVPNGVRSFVERGGAVLVASDRDSGDALRDLAGVRIDGEVVERAGGTGEVHRNQPDRPFVSPVEPNLPDGSVNPFAGLKVATNIPSYLSPPSQPATLLACFPPDIVLRNARVRIANAPQLFAVGGVLGEGREAGRFLILADHSVFINEMLLAPDCGNLDFTVRSLQWLRGGERTHAMLVEDGKVYSNFDVPLQPLPPPPPLEVLAEMFKRRDELIDSAQRELGEKGKERGLNAAAVRGLGGRDGDSLADVKRYVLWALGGCLAALALFRVAGEGRYRDDPGLPPLARAVARQCPAGPATEQRQRAQVDAGNLWESARELARQRLSRGAPPGVGPPPPRATRGGWFRRRAARARARRLWDLAYGATPVRVKPADWELFLFDLDAFKHDLADGTVELPDVGHPGPDGPEVPCNR
jgi:hypothetical protein